MQLLQRMEKGRKGEWGERGGGVKWENRAKMERPRKTWNKKGGGGGGKGGGG